MTHPSIRTLDGDERSQELAREAFPILVRQARACEPITYGELAEELDSHPRPMRFPLGIIGRAIEDLGEQWDAYIPPIQSFVVSKRDGVPSKGIASYTKHPEEYRNADTEERRAIAARYQHAAHEFGRWDEVLDHFSLSMPEAPLPAVPSPERPNSWSTEPSEESEAHRALKKRIAEDPTLVGLSSSHGPGNLEYSFPSGDTADVVFNRIWGEWIAVEVKTSRSDRGDIIRGLFQCVKYEALLQARAVAAHRSVTTEALLALDCDLPAGLIELAHGLGVNVREDVNSDRAV